MHSLQRLFLRLSRQVRYLLRLHLLLERWRRVLPLWVRTFVSRAFLRDDTSENENLLCCFA